MTELSYLNDAYMKEFDTKVTSLVDSTHVILDHTFFYPAGGGQPCDHGTLTHNTETYTVHAVKKTEHGVIHEVNKEGLHAGDIVRGSIDWKRRYTLMRYHTAAHVLSGVFSHELNAVITGNQLDIDKGRIDFNLDTFNQEHITALIAKANVLIQKNLPVKVYYMKKVEALRDKNLFKLATTEYIERLPEQLRIVDIEGFDRQADGGTHVNTLKEIGTIQLLKCDNKGKNNRRVYFTLAS